VSQGDVLAYLSEDATIVAKTPVGCASSQAMALAMERLPLQRTCPR